MYISNKSPNLSLNYQDVSINEIKFNSYVYSLSLSATAKMDHSPQNQTLVFLGIEWDMLVGLVPHSYLNRGLWVCGKAIVIVDIGGRLLKSHSLYIWLTIKITLEKERKKERLSLTIKIKIKIKRSGKNFW